MKNAITSEFALYLLDISRRYVSACKKISATSAEAEEHATVEKEYDLAASEIKGYLRAIGAYISVLTENWLSPSDFEGIYYAAHLNGDDLTSSKEALENTLFEKYLQQIYNQHI